MGGLFVDFIVAYFRVEVNLSWWSSYKRSISSTLSLRACPKVRAASVRLDQVWTVKILWSKITRFRHACTAASKDPNPVWRTGFGMG